MKMLTKLSCLLALSMLAACGGGGGATSALPSAGGAPAAAIIHGGTVVASATVSGGLPLAKSALRKMTSLRNTLGYTIANVEVDGTLYEGIAGGGTISNKQTFVPSGGAVAINMTFSNVPAGNNSWMVLQLYGVAADGSKFDLGELASVVNVTAGQASNVNLGLASTQRFEVFNALLNSANLSSTDLQNANLDSTLGAQIAAAGMNLDPATQLYPPLELNKAFTVIAPQYARSITITPDSNLQNLYIMPDYTSVAESNLQQNVGSTNFYVPTTAATYPVITPCYNSTVPPNIGPGVAPSPKPGATCENSYSVNGGAPVTINNVYGGPLLIGGTVDSGTAPFTGGWKSIAGTPAGTVATATLTLAPTNQTIAVSDSAAWAMPNYYGCAGTSQCYYVKGDPNYFNPFNYGGLDNNQTSVADPANFSATSNIVTANAFGYADEPASGLLFCSRNQNSGLEPTDPCTALSTIGSSTINIHREFADSGENFSYFNWQPSAGIAASQGYASCTPQGMVIVTNGQPSGTITSTTPTYFGQTGSTSTIEINGSQRYNGTSLYADNACAGPTYDGSGTPVTWTATVTDTNNTVYTGSVTQDIGSNYIYISMPSITKTIAAKSVAISYSIASGVTVPAGFAIGNMYEYVSGSGCCAVARHPVSKHKR